MKTIYDRLLCYTVVAIFLVVGSYNIAIQLSDLKASWDLFLVVLPWIAGIAAIISFTVVVTMLCIASYDWWLKWYRS